MSFTAVQLGEEIVSRSALIAETLTFGASVSSMQWMVFQKVPLLSEHEGHAPAMESHNRGGNPVMERHKSFMEEQRSGRSVGTADVVTVVVTVP